MKEVRITAHRPRIEITVSMGDGPATLTGGIGGWKTVDRADDISFSAWEGQASLTQDVPLLLDGWGQHPQSVERELNTLFKLGRDFDNTNRSAPPVFKVEGPVFYPGKSWVLPEGGLDLNTEDTIRLGDGTLVRQSMTLHLLEYVNPDTLRRRGKAKQGATPRTTGAPFPNGPYFVTTQTIDTLVKVAAKVYGNWEVWKRIAATNGRSGAETQIPVGTKLILP